MSTTYFAIQNHASTRLGKLSVHPSSVMNSTAVPGAFSSKEVFREWCRQTTTSHVFYTLWEPTLKNERVSASNPPHALHGFVADYDSPELAPLKTDEILDVIKKKAPGGFLPTWVTRTYSKKVRAIWEFERPVTVDSETVREQFVTQFIKEAKIARLLKGYDGCSEDPKMTWELGTDWRQLGASIPATTLERLFYDALKDATIKVKEVRVPLEVVAAKVEEVFPGRWQGAFEVGSRGPLFWINDGIDRVGAMVGDNGMICFSTRAGTSFASWADIFGAAFVKGYEETRLAQSVDGVYFDGTRYWLKSSDEVWRALSKEDYVLRLRLSGFSHNPRKKGDPASEIDEVLRYVQDTRRIDSIGPFVFRKEETVHFNGQKFLNSPKREPMKPAAQGEESDFPWLATYFRKIWDPHPVTGIMPRDYFLAWLQRTYTHALEGNPVSGQAVIMAGPKGVGKSLFATYIMREIFGGGTDAGKYLLEGGSGFSKELGSMGVWWVDDNTSASSFNDHRRFSEMLKKFVATPLAPYHPKYQDSVLLPWYGRLLITCNLDADSLTSLPQLDGTILDKLMLFKLNLTYAPDFLPNAQMETLLQRELPHFLRWLMDYDPNPEVLDPANPRYGVKSYHHPDLMNAAREASPDHRLAEILDMWVKQMKLLGEEDVWEGSSTELLARMSLSDELKVVLRDYTPIKLGNALGKIVDYYPTLQRRSLNGKSIYRIQLAE